MAGLLDFFGNGWDDPKSNAVMALAGGLLDGDFASGVKGYANVMQGAGDAKYKRAMQQAQIDNIASEIAARKLAGIKDERQQELIKSVFGGIQNKGTGVGEVPFPMGGMSTPMGNVNTQQGNIPMPEMQPLQQGKGSVLGNLRPDDIARLKLGGLDLTDIFKYANDPQKLEQGATYKDRNTGAERFMPKVGEGMMPNQQGVYGFAPGYAEAQAKFEGDKTRAIEGAKSQFGMTTVTRPDGSTYLAPNDIVLGAARGQSPQQTAPMQQPTAYRSPAGGEAQIIANGMGGLNGLPTTARGGNVSMKSTPAEMDKPRILQDAYTEATTRFTLAQKAGDTANMQRAKSDLESIQRELGGGRTPSLAPSLAPNTAPQSAPSFGLELQSQAGKDQQKLTSENAGKVNDVFLKSVYTPLIESKGATSATIDSINQSRAALSGLGGTGWGTETKATAANVLTGLGIGGKNAEMYATNAQTFQQAAMTRLQSELQLQKGMQTEGDAARQANTYAQLKNTPQANAYILDSAQAKAERDLMKAKFYESALPIASKKGDLQEIDREWNKRAPSLFAMPSMQKWAKK